MISFALFLCGAIAAPPTVPLIDRSHIATVEAVVAQLRPPVGTRIRVSANLRGVYAYLDPHGASASVALRTLATALHASVTETPGVWTLGITKADEKATERERVADRVAWIRSRVDEVKRYRSISLKGRTLPEVVAGEVQRETELSEEISKHLAVAPDPHFATELLPTEDLLLALIHKIGETNLAAVPMGVSRVWEDAPVPGASALPAYQESLDAYEKAVAQVRGQPLSPRLRAGIDRLGMDAFFADWKDVATPLARLRVRVRSESTRLLVSLEGYDAAGGQRTAATLIAMPTLVWQPPERNAAAELNKPDASWVPLSSTNLAVSPPRITVVAADRKAPSWFTEPERDEPIDRMAGEALAALEPGETRRCVAVQAADGLWGDVRPSVVGSRLSLAALRTMMRERSGYERLETPEGVVWRVRGVLGREVNADRRTLGSFARSTLRNGVLDLRSVSTYHNALGTSTTDLSRSWESALRYSPAVRTFAGGATHAFYRTLGAISASSWDRLVSGAPQTVDRLGVDGEFGAELDEDQTPVISPTPFPDVLKHPRESFGRDAPGASVVALASSRTPLIGTTSQGDRGDRLISWTSAVPIPAPIDIAEAGSFPPLTRERYERWMGRFLVQFGYQDRITARVRFPNGLTQAAEFTDPVVATSTPAEYVDLPQRTKDAMWERAQRAESS